MTYNGTYSVTGTYTAKCSTSYQSGQADQTCGQAFRGLGFQWTSSINKYNGSTGAYTGATTTTISGTSRAGEWLQIQTPFSFILKSFSAGPHISATKIYAKTIYVAGSTDGTTWNSIGTISASSYTTITGTFSENTTSYNYYRFVVNLVSLNSGDTVACLQNVVLSS